MAEAIATLGFASNILQVIQFVSNFASKVWAIYQHGNDALEEVRELRQLAENIKHAQRQLQDHGDSHRQGSGNNKAKEKLAQECSTVLDDILDSLNKIGDVGGYRRRDAILAALKNSWNELTFCNSRSLTTWLTLCGNGCPTSLRVVH
jgi:methylthioribose-1-phosphate isomerase